MRRRIAPRRATNPDDAPPPPITRGGVTTFARLLRYIRPYWRWMSVAVFALIVSSLLGLVLPLVVRNLVDFVFVRHKPVRGIGQKADGRRAGDSPAHGVEKVGQEVVAGELDQPWLMQCIQLWRP